MPTRSAAVDLKDPITKHLRNGLPCLRQSFTVGEALERIRTHPPTGTIIYFYVVDDSDRLVGVIPTRKLLLASLETTLVSIMIMKPVYLTTAVTVLEACELFILHRFLALPVVDEERKLIGTVDIELYADEIRGTAERDNRDDLFQLIGVHVDAAKQGTSSNAFRLRFPWLTSNIVGGLLAALLSSLFHETLGKMVILAFFIPVVLSLADAVAMQSVSLAIQGLRSSRKSFRQTVRLLGREASTGWRLGLASGPIVAAAALIWTKSWVVMLAVGASIIASLTVTAVIGMVVPLLLHALRKDPKVAAGPVALVTADLLALLCYFGAGALLSG